MRRCFCPCPGSFRRALGGHLFPPRRKLYVRPAWLTNPSRGRCTRTVVKGVWFISWAGGSLGAILSNLKNK